MVYVLGRDFKTMGAGAGAPVGMAGHSLCTEFMVDLCFVDSSLEMAHVIELIGVWCESYPVLSRPDSV